MISSRTEAENISSGDAGFVMDDETGVEGLLAKLSNGQLAQRIADTARLALAQHMLQQAQAKRSSVEAENSTQ